MPELTNKNTLFIGLGGTGGRVLKELRKHLYEEFGEIPAGLGFMYVDSSQELMQQNDPTWLASDGYNVQFTNRDFLNISLPSDGNSFIGNLKYYPNLKEHAENCEGLKNYHPNYGAMQNRRIGRIQIGASATSFERMLHDHYHQLQHDTNNCHVNMTIVTSLSGGTGSGAVVSVIAHILRMYPEKVSLYATLPAIPFPYDCGRSLANTYAALRELNALNIGRLKVTDLVTGEQWQPELPYDNSLNYCHHLQENKLFRLFLFDNFFCEYDKIANILFHNLWLGGNSAAVSSYKKCLDMYNVIPEPEFDATTPEGEEHVYVRTKAVGSLGLCRIVYPRKAILQHLAQSAISQAICQMLYNNFRDCIGFVDEVAVFDYKEICRLNKEKWHLDYESLTIQRPVLIEDRIFDHVRPFIDEWEDRVKFYSYKDAETEANEQQNAFDVLSDYAENIYLNVFRHHSGVETYFAHKRHAVTEYAKEINHTIEKQLFSSWLSGEYGLCQIFQTYKALEEELKECSTALTKQTERLSLCVADRKKNIDSMLEEVDGMSKFIIGIKKLLGEMEKRYSDFKGCLVSYYSDRTELVSLEFAQELMQRLRQEIYNTENNLYKFICTLNCMNENAQRKSEDLLIFCTQSNLKGGFINIGKRRDIELYKMLMCSDRDFMQGIASQIRTTFTDETELFLSRLLRRWEYCNTADFLQRSLTESIVEYDNANKMTGSIIEHVRRMSPYIFKYLDSGMTTEAFAENIDFNHRSQIKMVLEYAEQVYHELMNASDILKTNLLQEMNTQFPTTESLITLIRGALSAAGNNIPLNEEETMKVVRNSPLPDSAWQKPAEVILVRLPRPHVANKKEQYITEKLKALIIENCGTTQIEIDNGAPDMQEISVAHVCVNFPLRCIDSLHELKQQYDELMVNEKSMYILHTEDSFTNLPSLEIEEYI